LHTPPIIQLDRRALAGGEFGDYTSVIGGYVYRGSALPQLRGVYLFGDYEGDRMVALRQCGMRTSPHTVILKNRNANMPSTPSFARGQPAFNLLTAIVQGNDSELYFVADFVRLLKVVPGSWNADRLRGTGPKIDGRAAQRGTGAARRGTYRPYPPSSFRC
jgi:hypothetical protein